jgi:predicted pyridoxine 5'-phosphate oxidase superfamily flavin-nucleotide-binding protein
MREMLEPLIDDEVKAFIEAPCSLIVGTVDDDGLPDATRAWGVEVQPGGRQLRLLVATNADVTLANLTANGRIALTATDFLTNESTQLKGRVGAVEERTSADRIRFDAYCARCIQILTDVDRAPAELVGRMIPPGVVACMMTVEQVFDQTPGPAAGAQLAPTDGAAGTKKP